MGLEYFIFYTEASLICIVILLILFINDRVYGTKQEKQIWFNRAIIGFILYFASDACWAAVLSNQLPRTRPLVELVNLTNYVLLSFVAYEWFMFMAASEKMDFRKDRGKRLWCAIPMVLSVTVILIAYALKPYYWINEENELCQMYYPMLLAAPAFYLVIAFIFSVYNARKADSREDRKLCWLIGTFPLGIMAFGLVQVVSLNAPTFCFGSTIMFLFFYIQNMQTLISLDALTKLNNRGQINRYMEQVSYKENTKVFVMMIDIDGFKQINDTYGHAEGDRALILVSDALKQICEGLKATAFLGRYGGDEFIVIIQNPEEDEYPEHVAKAIQRSLDKRSNENLLTYELEVSIGYDELVNRNDSMQACMVRADKMLYDEKRGKYR